MQWQASQGQLYTRLPGLTAAVTAVRLRMTGVVTPAQRRREQGQVLLWMAILLPLFLALTGLVFDGGIMWQQYMRARWAASAGCVAAASEIDPQVFADTGRMVLKMPDAPQTAVNYASWNDPDLHLTAVYVTEENNEPRVVAEGYTQIEPVFLQMFGVTGFRATVRAIERPEWGVVGAGD